MKIHAQYQPFCATLFLVVYFFAAFFANNVHNHGSGEIFKSFALKHTETSFDQSNYHQEYSDCYSCHMLHSNISVVPDDFIVCFTPHTFFRIKLLAYQQTFSNLQPLTFQLRGPPVI